LLLVPFVEIALKLADFCRQVTLWSGETA